MHYTDQKSQAPIVWNFRNVTSRKYYTEGREKGPTGTAGEVEGRQYEKWLILEGKTIVPTEAVHRTLKPLQNRGRRGQQSGEEPFPAMRKMKPVLTIAWALDSPEH